MNELQPLILEVRSLCHALNALADAVHRDLGVTASQRAVLEALAIAPGQTVPGIARMKGVSRQHIQALVNQLVEAGLVEAEANPAHRRSPVLNLSANGRRCFASISEREGLLLATMRSQLRAHDLEAAQSCLRALHEQVRASLASAEHGADRAATTGRE